jgi:hypothetical protein
MTEDRFVAITTHLSQLRRKNHAENTEARRIGHELLPIFEGQVTVLDGYIEQLENELKGLRNKAREAEP